MSVAFQFDLDVSLTRAFRRVVASEVDGAVESLSLVVASGDPSAVHDVRKRTKKVRAALRLVGGAVPRGELRDAHRRVAEAAKVLGARRDAHAQLLALVALLGDRQAEFADALAYATRRAALTPAGDGDAAGDRVDAAQHASWLLTSVASDVATWRVPNRFSSLEDGLSDAYRQGRRGLGVVRSAADPLADTVVDDLHRWRRAVKSRWYHTRLLVALAPDVLGAEGALLGELGEVLGDDHDLAGLVAAIADDPSPWGGAETAVGLGRLVADRRAFLVERALGLGRQLYVATPGEHTVRFSRWWRDRRGRPSPG